MKEKSVYTLAKIWSEWSSRAYIGMATPTVCEIAAFLQSLRDAGMRIEHVSGRDLEEDAEAITEGWETEEEAVSQETSTVRYDISVIESDEYPVRRSVRIAAIIFTYVPRSIRDEKVTVYEISRKIEIDGLRTIRFSGGDGDGCTWYELPSSPVLCTADWKWFFVEMPQIEQYFEQRTEDGAFMLRRTSMGIHAPFDTYSEQLI